MGEVVWYKARRMVMYMLVYGKLHEMRMVCTLINVLYSTAVGQSPVSLLTESIDRIY